MPPPDLGAAAFLFDMDGTLVDSTAVVEDLWTRFAAEHDLDPAEVIAFAHGRQTPDTVTRFVGGRDGVDVREVVGALERAEVVRTDGIVEIPGAAALLAALRDAGAPVAVVTSAPRELALVRMDAAGVDVPEVLVAAEDVANGKPAPDGYLDAARLLGVPAGSCVGFEDTGPGLESVLASGAAAVVVGDHSSAVTAGLPRLADYRGVEVRAEDGRFRLRRAVAR